MKVQQEIANLEQNVIALELQANHEEGALMRAMVVWDILNQYSTGRSQAGEHSLAQKRIIIEKEAVQQLYRMFQMKGNYFQGKDIEYVAWKASKAEAEAQSAPLSVSYTRASSQDIFEDEGESLQQEFQVDAEGNEPAVLRFYKNIRAEVLETAEQLKNLKTTALRVAGVEGREESFDRAASSQDNEKSYDNRMVSNSNMLNDMMRKRGDPARDFSVEDMSGNRTVEGTTKAWLQNQKNEFPPPQTTESWPQQNQMHRVRPEYFGQVQGISQFPQVSVPLGRPCPGMQQSAKSFAPVSFGPAFPGPIPQNNARSMNQPPPMRPSNQPYVAAGLSAPSFLPRGFQQQVGSMPRPPAPNSPAQRPFLQSTVPSGNSAQMPLQTVGVSEQSRFNTPGMMLAPSGGMMNNRQQPGLNSPASQVPSRFAMQRMQAPPPVAASGPQQFIQVSPQAAAMSSQMQQQMMRPQAGVMPLSSSIPPRMPPQMAQQNFPGSPQNTSSPQNFPRQPMQPMGPVQQTFTRPTQMGLASQNFNRPPAHEAARPQVPALQFSPRGAVPRHPM